MTSEKPKFKFIDLFAGIGGFHQAMRKLGGECVLACEIDAKCVETYSTNFPSTPVVGDICELDPATIPEFDMLCAGFPCQPFSKAGYQRGFGDEKRGKLFYRIIDILKVHKEAKFILLENVRNLADNKDNWNIIQTELLECGFCITQDPLILSPSHFHLPQIRERVFILGIRKDIVDGRRIKDGVIRIGDLELGEGLKKNNCDIGDAWQILEDDVPDEYIISPEVEKMIFAWDELLKATNVTRIGCPFWLSCFGVRMSDEEAKQSVGYDEMPEWKKGFYNKNRSYYLAHKEIIDSWVDKYDMMNKIKLHQKYEWNCGDFVDDIRDTIIQVRQSGIRVKKPDFFPSLVAMRNTPIVWDKKKEHFRFITPREAGNLQNFDKNYIFNEVDNLTYRQLGNSVNVKVLEILGEQLFKLAKPRWSRK